MFCYYSQALAWASFVLLPIKSKVRCTMKFLLVLFLLILSVYGGHYIIPGHLPYDGYHDLHLPHNPPLYPTLARVPPTTFTCLGKSPGYYADVETGCQAYHLCEVNTAASFLCTNGTLFNEQFQVCDQFYNVRCGSPYIDL